jgi:hypothetical protein
MVTTSRNMASRRKGGRLLGHDNGIDTLVAGGLAKLEGLYPHAPALSGERLVYPQTEGD